MYEKLDKLRADLERAKKRRDDAEQKVQQLEAKLKEEGNNQIIADVCALNLSPEQVGELMDLVRKGGIPALHAAMANAVPAQPETIEYGNTDNKKESEYEEDEEDEM